MIGILLINLGTPDAPTTSAVRKYLREFLSDPQVIDIHPLMRWMLVNFIISPFRSPKSAALYEKIWTREGSPLLVHTRNLTEEVGKKLGSNYRVAFGMRYGQPSIRQGLESLIQAGVSSIKVLPLYPQFALSSTQSTIDHLRSLLPQLKDPPALEILPPFYNHPAYIDSFFQQGVKVIKGSPVDHILFSFHGLPEHQVKKTDSTGQHCFQKENCCDVITDANNKCYRAQCFATARAIAKKMQLKEEDYTICFQSRLGRRPWIRPYTDEVILELPKKGIKNVAVFCPAFVADCLETLEEIALRSKDLFISAGGKELKLIPSLNAEPIWVEGLSQILSS